MIGRAGILKYVEKKYGTLPEHLWRKTPNNAILRHADNGKWYCALLTVSRNRLGLKGEGQVEIIDVKCTPELSGILRQTPGYLPGYHMNKEHWLTIILDGSVPENEIFTLIDQSFDLTK